METAGRLKAESRNRCQQADRQSGLCNSRARGNPSSRAYGKATGGLPGMTELAQELDPGRS